ncbi:MAG: dihydroorotate dehydrogenase electron transfer subunit [Bacillota bacterium]
MNKAIFTIKSNQKIAKDVFEMQLCGDTSEVKASGQFVNIKLDGKFLRRPISICDYKDGKEDGKLTLIYKVVGGGTDQMSQMTAGETLDLLVCLGNGFDTSKSGDTPLLIGGGVGVPPMFNLAKRLISEGKKVSVILGFGSNSEVFYREQFEKIGASVAVTTVDGSCGTKGFVTNAMDIPYSYFFTCGPEAMLKAIFSVAKTSGQLSFEERMGCGFGGCMGCSCKTIYGNKRICVEGPVLEKEEILW